jgi:hypothetical protein
MLHDSLNRLKFGSANTSSRNPRVTRSVNVSELQFDDNEPNPNAYETHVHDITHDIDTSIDDIMGHYSVNVNDRAPVL